MMNLLTGTFRKLRFSGWPSLRAIPLALLLCVAYLGIGASETKESTAGAAAKPGGVAPITVASADQIKEALTKAKGKVVIVNFWATYCPPCVAEMPEFVSFYKTYQGKDAVLISVNCDDPSTVDSALKPFLASKKIEFPVRVLSSGPEEISKALGVEWDGGLPGTLVFDAAGKLKKSWFEGITVKDLSAAVDPLLAAKSPAK